MKDETYNGWSNYATWRVNLELFSDGIDEEERYDGIPELAENLKERADEAITEYGGRNEGLAVDYARAFLEDVDWREIAESLAEDYPSIISK